MSVAKAVEPAASAPAVTITSESAEARRFLDRRRKIVVMGAGLSGLTVAYMLSRVNTRFNIKTLDITVVESRDAVGGVIRSRLTPYGTFELGAPWVDCDAFTTKGKLFLDVVESLGLEHHFIVASQAPKSLYVSPLSSRLQSITGGFRSYLSTLRWLKNDFFYPRMDVVPDMAESARSWMLDRGGVDAWDRYYEPCLSGQWGCDVSTLDASVVDTQVRLFDQFTGLGLMTSKAMALLDRAPPFIRYALWMQSKVSGSFQSSAAKLGNKFSFRGGMQTLTDTLRLRCEQGGVRFVTGATVESVGLDVPVALHSWSHNRFLDSGIEVGDFSSGVPCRIRPGNDNPPLQVCYRERSLMGAAVDAVAPKGTSLVAAGATTGTYGSGVGGWLMTRKVCIPAHHVVNTMPGAATARVLLRSTCGVEGLILSSHRRQTALSSAEAAAAGISEAEKQAAGGLQTASLRSERADTDQVVRLVESLESSLHILSCAPPEPWRITSALRAAAAALTNLPIQVPPHPYSEYGVALRNAQHLRASDVAVASVGVAHEAPLLLAGAPVGRIAVPTAQRRRYALAHLSRALGLEAPSVPAWSAAAQRGGSISGSAVLSVWINDPLFVAVHEAMRLRRVPWRPSHDIDVSSGAAAGGVRTGTKGTKDTKGVSGVHGGNGVSGVHGVSDGVMPSSLSASAPSASPPPPLHTPPPPFLVTHPSLPSRIWSHLSVLLGAPSHALWLWYMGCLVAMLHMARWPDTLAVARALGGQRLTLSEASSQLLPPSPAALHGVAAGVSGVVSGATCGPVCGAHVAPSTISLLSSLFPQQRLPSAAAPAPVLWCKDSWDDATPASFAFMNQGTGRRVAADGVDRLHVAFVSDPLPPDPEDGVAVPYANLSAILAQLPAPKVLAAGAAASSATTTGTGGAAAGSAASGAASAVSSASSASSLMSTPPSPSLTATSSTSVTSSTPPSTPRFILNALGAHAFAHVRTSDTPSHSLVAVANAAAESAAAAAADTAASSSSSTSSSLSAGSVPPPVSSNAMEGIMNAAWEGAGRVLRPLLRPFKRTQEETDNIAAYPGSAQPTDRDYPQLVVAAHLPHPRDALDAALDAIDAIAHPSPRIEHPTTSKSSSSSGVSASASPTSPAAPVDVLRRLDPSSSSDTLTSRSVVANMDGTLSVATQDEPQGGQRLQRVDGAIATGAPSGSQPREVVFFDYAVIPEAIPAPLRGHSSTVGLVAKALSNATNGRLVCTGSHWNVANNDATSTVAGAVEVAMALEKDVLRMSNLPIDLAQPLPLGKAALDRLLVEPPLMNPLIAMDADRHTLRAVNEAAWRNLPSKITQKLAQFEPLSCTMAAPGLTPLSQQETREFLSKFGMQRRLNFTEMISRRRLFSGPFEMPESLRGGLGNDANSLGGWYVLGVTMNPALQWAIPYYAHWRR